MYWNATAKIWHKVTQTSSISKQNVFSCIFHWLQKLWRIARRWPNCSSACAWSLHLQNQFNTAQQKVRTKERVCVCLHIQVHKPYPGRESGYKLIQVTGKCLPSMYWSGAHHVYTKGGAKIRSQKDILYVSIGTREDTPLDMQGHSLYKSTQIKRIIKSKMFYNSSTKYIYIYTSKQQTHLHAPAHDLYTSDTRKAVSSKQF